MGSVAVVVAEALLRESDISVLVVSLLSLSLSGSSGSTVVQHASSLGLLSISGEVGRFVCITKVKHISLDLKLCVSSSPSSPSSPHRET